jgi:hypothetical protein
MARYIDADKKVEELENKIDSLTRLTENRPYDEAIKRDIGTYESFLIELQNTPTADVVEVKCGHWIENDYRSFDGFETVVYPNEALKCSECSHNFKKELLWRKNYCPECGAKMDGERKCDNG